MYRGDTIPGAIFALVGAFFFVATWLNPSLSFIASTSDGVPGAGFFPFIMSASITLMGVVLSANGVLQKGKVTYLSFDAESKQNLVTAFLTVVGVVAFIAGWQSFGYFFALAFLLCVCLNLLYKRGLRFSFIYSTVFCVFVYLVFELGFSIQFDM